MRFILSFILGLLPEVIFFTMFLINVKDIKTKKFKLFISLSIIYLLLVLIQNYKILNYILFLALVYIALKILYKKETQIIDLFVFSISYIYVFLISYICFQFVNDNVIVYWTMFAIDRILLFIPFIFKNKFNILYKKYCSLWNRNYEKKQPIKSITLRNISLISLNIFIFLCNIVCLYILSLKG